MAKPDPEPRVNLEPRVVAAPPRAAAAGYTNLIFEDDFQSLDIAFGENKGEKWNAGLWWDVIPDKSCFETSGTALKITVPPGEDHIDLCTQWHNQSTTPNDNTGIMFQPGGYFEARICTFNWDAFWLFCWHRPWNWGASVDPNNPMTWTNEIDILESDGGYPYWCWQTLHKNTSSDGLPDEQNWPHICESNKVLVGEWHDYGLLWTRELLTFFVDGIPCREVKPYESTWQPVQLILTAGIGGVGGSPTKTDPPIIRVDWVRVWQGDAKKAEPEPAMANADERRAGPSDRKPGVGQTQRQ